jgi:hypothetical protein
MLDPTSNYTWRLDVRYRFRGKPTNLAKRWKTTLSDVIVNLTKILSGVDPLDPECLRTLADMLDPDSDHELRLEFKQRKRGRPPLAPPRMHPAGVVAPPIEDDPAMRLARHAERNRGAKDSGPKLLHKQVHGIHNRPTYYRRLKLLREVNKTAGRQKGGSPK